MLTRPTRNILLLIAVVLSVFLVDSNPLAAKLLAVLVLVWLLLLSLSRHFLLARFLGSRKRWREAIAHYERFESTARRLRLGSVSLPFFMSIYTYNGIALAKNNMAFCYMNCDGRHAFRRQGRLS